MLYYAEGGCKHTIRRLSVLRSLTAELLLTTIPVVCAGAHIGLGSVVKANCTIESGTKSGSRRSDFFHREGKSKVQTAEVLEDAVYAFGFGNQCSYVKPFGEGHINETYAVYMPDP